MTQLHFRDFSNTGEQQDSSYDSNLHLLSGTGTYSWIDDVAYIKSAGAYACVTDRAVVPPTPNYSVSADVKINTIISGHSAGVLLRGSTTIKQAYYLILYADGTLKLHTDGPWGTLASVSCPISAGTTRRVKGVIDGNQIWGYVDDVLLIGPVTSNLIADAGYIGYTVWADTAGASATTGMVIDNLSLDTLDSGSSINAAASGGAVASGTANASLSGGGSSLNAAAAGAAVASGSAAATLTAPGTITIPALTEWETGNLLPGQTGITVWVNDEGTGVLVAKLTGQASHGTTAVCTITHAAIVAGTDYSVRIRLASGAQYTWTYTAT